MKHQITLTENDYCLFQLYEASTNPLKIKTRKRSYFFLSIIFIPLALIGYQNGNNFFFYYGITLTLLAILFGNVYIKWRHKRHYTKHVKDVRKNSFGVATEIEVQDELITTADKTGISAVKISEIEVINEIAGHYLIKITTGPTLIVPKTNTALNEEILAMIERHRINHVVQLNWKW